SGRDGEREGVDRQSRGDGGSRARDQRASGGGGCPGRGIGRVGAKAGRRRRDRPGATMTLRLHDTLSGETRPLEPLTPGFVGIYSCGPTVYGPVHVGNFRSFLFADILARYLRYRGLRVRWVMNITDVDDKIIRGAAAAGVAVAELAERWTQRGLVDARTLRMS